MAITCRSAKVNLLWLPHRGPHKDGMAMEVVCHISADDYIIRRSYGNFCFFPHAKKRGVKRKEIENIVIQLLRVIQFDWFWCKAAVKNQLKFRFRHESVAKFQASVIKKITKNRMNKTDRQHNSKPNQNQNQCSGQWKWKQQTEMWANNALFMSNSSCWRILFYFYGTLNLEPPGVEWQLAHSTWNCTSNGGS